MEKINKLYEACLRAAFMCTNASGLISTDNIGGGGMMPITVGGKRLVMSHGFTDDKTQVLFHPIVPSSTTTVDPVIEKWKTGLTLRIHSLISDGITGLLLLAANTALHSKMTMDEIELINGLADVDENTIKAWDAIVNECSPGDKRSLMSVYVKRSARIGGSTFYNGWFPSFPAYTELVRLIDEIRAEHDQKVTKNKVPREVYGVKLRNKDRDLLRQAWNTLLPDVGDESAYCEGSREPVGSLFHVIVKGVTKIFAVINRVLLVAEKYLGNRLGSKPIDLSVFSAVDEMNSLESEIRAYGKVATPVQGGHVAPQVQQQFNPAVPQAAPMVNQAPTVRAPGEAVSAADFLKGIRPAQPPMHAGQPHPHMAGGYPAPHPAPGHAYPPQMQGYPQPMQGYPQPVHGYPQHAPQGPAFMNALQPVQPAPGYGYPQPVQGYPQPMQGYPQPVHGYPQPVQMHQGPAFMSALQPAQPAQGYPQGNPVYPGWSR